MNMNFFPKPNWYRIVSFFLLTLTICAGVLTAVFVDNGRRDPVDNLAPGPYVVEKFDDVTGVQLFAMPKDESMDGVIFDYPRWTRDLSFAERYGTMAQAVIGRDRAGVGHVAMVREIVKK